MKIAILSEQKCKIFAPWYNTVKACEREFSSVEESPSTLLYFKPSIREINSYIWRVNTVVRKYVSKANHAAIRGIEDYSLLKKIDCLKPDYCLYIAMGCDDLFINKETLKRLSAPLIVYCYDTWTSLYDRWLWAFKEIKPQHIFLAYKQSAEYFRDLLGEHVHYLPQSFDNEFFKDYGLEKSRLFMQMGRQVPILHELANTYLSKNRISNADENYLYPRQGSLVSPTMEGLARNINSTFFFFAAPQNVHNVAFTGGISEVTARYYEAMACKSLVVGYKPLDSFDYLFPHDTAMISLDSNESNFENIVNYWLDHTSEYMEAVSYNHEFVFKWHSLSQRYAQMLNMIAG